MAFLVFGGIMFWVFVGIAALLLMITVESYKKSEETLQGELGWPVTITLIVIALLIYSNNPQAIFEAFKENWVNWILILLGFIIIGILWSFMRWVKVVKRSHKRYLKHVEDVKGSENPHLISPKKMFQPTVDGWKASIAAWILFWPFSVLRYIFGSAVIDFISSCIDKLKGRYDKITERIYKD